MNVRIQVSRDRRVETERELSDCAGSQPKYEDDGSLVYKFNSREFGSLFLANARVTAGVTKVMEA